MSAPIEWIQSAGPVFWRSRDRRYTVAQTYVDGRTQYRATYSGCLSCTPLGPLRDSPDACKADAEAHAAKAQAVTS